MTRDDIKTGYLEHAALTQLHRWYQAYENPKTRHENQLDILDPDVTVKSGLGEAKGHDAYSARIKQIPSAWKNAHLVRSTHIEHGPDGVTRLTAEITYLNQGMLPEGAVRRAELTYTAVLERTETVLPKFVGITIAQNSEGVAEAFEDYYRENRLLSLAHYWLALIEDPARDPEPVREILAKDFSLNFSSGAITDFEGFKAWLAGPGSQVTASTHRISNFSHQQLRQDEYRLSMDLDWEGILPNDSAIAAKTRHGWTIEDDPAERFARIKTIDVQVLKPFAPKSAERSR